MKKLLIIAGLLFSLNISPAAACQPEKEQTTNETISTVFYDDIAHRYGADTTKDIVGGFWTIDIIGAETQDQETLKQLKTVYEGKRIRITYTGTSLDDAEIMNVTIIK